MSTALATQLAQLRAQSTNSLDLKAQKNAHSQSLLFEPDVAATQDFDTIYQMCYEGLEELCRLDSRFGGFVGNIFSEQSKQEDRTQMTAAQNQQLDGVLEEFLYLIGSKLLLKPAIKAVEWLVRRFRVHEKNTSCLVLSFLPLHTTPIFATLLSILPQKIPSTLKFLHPYIQSLANPPRHTIAYTASNNRPFLGALSAHVLKSSRLGYQHPALISFWASIATEAVTSMLDQARSARLESRKQNQEDVTLFFLPILNEGLSTEGASDLRVGCYMVMTILATKANLGDVLITALMEAVTSDWAQTSHAGLICLSVLAQQSPNAKLPKRVFKAVLALEKFEGDLMTLREQYKVERFTLGLVLGVISGLKRTRDANKIRLLRTLMEAGLMDEASTTTAIQSILSATQTMTPETNPNFDVQGSLTDLILRLADSSSIGWLVQTTIKEFHPDNGQTQIRLQRLLQSHKETSTLMIEDADMGDADEQTLTEDFETLTSRIPTRTAYEISFLSYSESYVFGSLEHAFIAMSASSTDVDRFSNLPVLRKSLAMSEPLFVSFFIRVWCGNSPAIARAAAIRSVSNYVGAEPLTADVQIILPYLLFALADRSPKVRRAAAELALALVPAYAKENENEKTRTKLPILGQEQIYGQGKETKELSWLSMNETHRFLADLLVPGLEECLLDERHISKLLSDNLNGSKHSKAANTIHKDLKTTLRLAIFNHLCSHVVNMPLYSVKFRLLRMLNQIPKVASTSRTKLLLPLLSKIVSQNQEEQESNCRQEELDPLRFLDQVVDIVTPADREGIQTLKAITQPEDQPISPMLRAATLRHIQKVWPSMKSDLQASFAKMLLEQAVETTGRQVGDDQGVQAIETLRALPLPTAILQSFLEALPTVSSGLPDKPPASKRRRTSHVQSMNTAHPGANELLSIVRQVTVVLELVEGSKPERHPELLNGLFHVFSDLQHSSSRSYTATGFLQLLAMDSMLAIVKKVENLSTLHVNRSAIRADVLVDCIRSTESPQVRNTALLLVSALATVAPELILHSVMPVFTFMGTNVLHQDDDFSAYVVKQTMESIVPRLVQSLHKRKEGPFAGVSELLLSFAAAFGHIPTQRRFDLFTSLADKVGPSDYLFALFAVMLDKYQNNRKVLQFATDLAGHYDVKTRLQTIEKYLQVILDVRRPKPTISARLLTIDGDHTADDAVANLLPLAVAVLCDVGLVSKASRIFGNEGEDAVAIRPCYEMVLEQVFILSEQCKSNKKLDAACMQVLDASLGLLPLWKLVGTLQSLLGRTEGVIRRQVLRSFEHRLNDRKLNQASQTACLAFLPQLVAVIEETPDTELRHTAISCVDRVTEKFGKKDPSAVLAAVQAISGKNCLGAAESSLQVISLLCLATMVEASGDMFISVVPKTFPAAINHLGASIAEDVEDESLHNAVYSFLGALLVYVPWAITGPDLDRLLIISYESANAEIGELCDQSRSEALALVPKQVELRECFAALVRTWPSAMTGGPLAVKELLQILRQAIDLQPKSMVVQQSETLGGLFLKILDLRRIQLSPPTEDSYDADDIDEVEDAVNQSAIAMIYKLNDATFRPLFLRILDWTTTPTSKKDDKARIYRQVTWYTFLLKFFDTLKSIVTSYAGLILEDSVEILKNFSPEDKSSTELWRRVTLTLSKTFEHDQDDFYQAPAHFAPVSTALLSQLAHAAEIPLLPELIPAIAELAVATDSSAHHKELNAAVLKYMRSNSAAVRLAAVQCEKALTERLGEEWLALLPEMLPFISEALEDDDEGVEKEVQRWVVGIEGILGESLDPMLQ